MTWNLSMTMDTTVSIREMADVSAANSTSRKNSAPTIWPNWPPPMLSNTLGRVWNISPGPDCMADWSPPEKTNTAGTIIRPARRATPVSKISIWETDFSILVSFYI